MIVPGGELTAGMAVSESILGFTFVLKVCQRSFARMESLSLVT